MKDTIFHAALVAAIGIWGAFPCRAATLGNKAITVEYNGRTGHLALSAEPYGRFLDGWLGVPGSAPSATQTGAARLSVTYPGAHPLTVQLAVDTGAGTFTVSAERDHRSAPLPIKGRIAWGANPLVCRLSPGPNPDIVQVAYGPASNRRCNAVYSRERDAGVVLSDCHPAHLFYGTRGHLSGVWLEGGTGPGELPILRLSIRRAVRTGQSARVPTDAAMVQPAAATSDPAASYSGRLLMPAHYRAQADEGAAYDDGSSWQMLVQSADRMARGLYLRNSRSTPAVSPVFLGPPLTLDQARAWATFASLTGGPIRLAEPIEGLPDDRQDIARHLAPSLNVRPVDLYPMSGRPRVWDLCVSREGHRWDVVGVFNWNGEDSRQTLAVEDLGLDPERRYLAFDYWDQRYLGVVQGSLSLDLPPTSCRVIGLRPAVSHPQVVSTSQNITQGVGDLQSVSWDAGRYQLNGASFVMAGVPCLVRISVPVGSTAYRCMGEQTEWGSVDESAEPGLVTLTLNTQRSGWVHWRAHFAAFTTGRQPHLLGPKLRVFEPPPRRRRR